MKILRKLSMRSRGAIALVIARLSPLFFDTFDSTNTSLTGRAGWTVIGDAPHAATVMSADGMARQTTSFNGQAPYGYQMTVDPGVQNRRVTFEYDYSQTAGGTLANAATPFQYFDQVWILAWTNESNYTYAGPGPMAGAVMEVRVQKVVAGVTTEMFRYAGISIAGTLTFEMSDRIRLYANGLLRVSSVLFNDAAAAYPDQLFAAGTDAVRTGPTGFRHTFYAHVLALSWQIELLNTVRIADPKPFYGRDATNKRTITFTGTYTGIPLSWAYSLRRRSTGAVVKNWTAISPTFGTGTWSIAIDVASGGPYFLDIGWTGSDGKTRVATSNYFAVGILVCCWGQSNSSTLTAVGGTTGYGGNDLIIGFNGYAAYSGFSNRRYMDELTPESLGYQPNMVGLAKSLSDATGIPVGVAAVGVAAQDMLSLKPGTSNWNTVLVPFVAEIGGNVEQWMWSQGEAEALSLSDYSAYVTNHALLVAGMRAIGGRSSAMVFNRIVGKDSGIVNDSTNTTRSYAVRSLLNGLENGTDVWTSSSSLGLPLSDTIHFTSVAATAWARRAGMTIARRAYAALAYDGTGPRVTGATRVGTVITLAVGLNGASGISGAALTGYAVSNDNFITTLPITSVGVSSNQIIITLVSTPTGTCKVRSYAEPNYTDTSLAIGAYPNSVTIPVFPIVDSITVV